jgi:hypothetical protein
MTESKLSNDNLLDSIVEAAHNHQLDSMLVLTREMRERLHKLEAIHLAAIAYIRAWKKKISSHKNMNVINAEYKDAHDKFLRLTLEFEKEQ